MSKYRIAETEYGDYFLERMEGGSYVPFFLGITGDRFTTLLEATHKVKSLLASDEEYRIRNNVVKYHEVS